MPGRLPPLAVLLGAVVALLSTAAADASRSDPAPFRLDRLQAVGAVRDTIVRGRRLARLEAKAGYWGGPIAAADGETVNILVSTSYPSTDPSLPQSVADFLVQLYHSAELQDVTIYILPLNEIQEACGLDAGGCYSPQTKHLFVPGEDLPDGTSRETILAHEYGHHVAASRANPPWAAIDWGPKRWATYEQVCSRAAAKAAFPGDEGEHYLLNPGEAWAETYRLLNYQKTTWPDWPSTPFSVDQSFAPDAGAFQAALEDVVAPWTQAKTLTLSGRFAAQKPKTAKASRKRPKTAALKLTPWKRLVPTTLDGSVSATLRAAPAGTTIALTDPATGKVVAGPARRVAYTDCGVRSLALTVRATRAGTFSLSLSTPG